MIKFNDPKAILESTQLLDNFVQFVKIDTQSDPESDTTPSAAKELDLQKVLKDKLTDLGCTEVKLDEFGYLYGIFPGNVSDAPVIGFISHVDTSPDFSGKDVNPVFHENYAGGVLTLGNDVTIEPGDNPVLAKCIGHTIITADGTTLLGADDKAGIAEILAALEVLSKDDSIKRPTIRIAFTPDEEVGLGASKFDVEGFDAHCAYTLDGSEAGEVNFETFSADKADVTVTGVAVHPGFAKGKLVNAITWLGKFVDMLPKDEAPETTELRQGFFHPTDIRGNAAKASTSMILRDFDDDVLAERGERVKELASKVMELEPRLKIDVEITTQYRNMAGVLADHPQIRENLMQAVTDVGLEPQVIPIRGGTDGSGLTAKGLPTPNIFTGGMNFHGPREWASTTVMAQSVCTVLNLVQRWAGAN